MEFFAVLFFFLLDIFVVRFQSEYLYKKPKLGFISSLCIKSEHLSVAEGELIPPALSQESVACQSLRKVQLLKLQI